MHQAEQENVGKNHASSQAVADLLLQMSSKFNSNRILLDINYNLKLPYRESLVPNVFSFGSSKGAFQ